MDLKTAIEVLELHQQQRDWHYTERELSEAIAVIKEVKGEKIESFEHQQITIIFSLFKSVFKNHTVIHSLFFIDARKTTTPLHHCVPYIVVCTRDYNMRNFNTFELI